MGEINVQGLGKVRIHGSTPSPEEEQAIIDGIMGMKKVPTPAIPGQRLQLGRGGNLRPEDIIQPDPRPFITQETGGLVSRPAFEAAGGTAGGVVGAGAGATTGPGMAATTLGGAALGAAAGSAAFDTVDAAARLIAGQPAREDEPLDPAWRALEAGRQELIWGGGALSLGPVFKAFKTGGGKLLGVGSEAVKKTGRAAESMGIPMGILQATDRKGLKGITRVLGVFPFVGTPIKTSAKESGIGIAAKFDDTLNTLAPNATMADLGVDLTTAAKGKFKQVKKIAGAMYDRFYQFADEASVKEIFPTDGVVKVASDLVAQKDAGKIILKTQKQLVTPTADPMADFLSDLREMPDHITAEQLRQLQRDLQDTAMTMQRDGYDLHRVIEVKKALEKSLNMPNVSLLPKEEGLKIGNALTNANAFYAENMKRFETATAKKFGRVDKNIFGPGAFKAGSRDSDEIFAAVFNSKSPQAVHDLRRVVGARQMGKATRKFLQESFNAAGGDRVADDLSAFNPDKFAEVIGIGTREGKQALSAMLHGTGVKVADLEAFVDVARKSGSIVIPDTSTFIQRRVTIGGIRNLLGGVALGAVGLQNPVGAVVGVLLTRKGAKILSSPSMLRSLSRAMDDTVPDMQRRALVLRVAREALDLTEEDQ